MQDKGMSWIQQAFIVAYAQTLRQTLTLTFELATWCLFATLLSCHDDHVRQFFL